MADNTQSLRAFVPGDIVMLKSSGPKMTVESVTETDATCRWTKSTGLVQRKDFPMVCLELIEAHLPPA